MSDTKTISGSADMLRNADVGHMLELREKLAEAELERDELAAIMRCHHDEPCTAIVLKQDGEIRALRDRIAATVKILRAHHTSRPGINAVIAYLDQP